MYKYVWYCRWDGKTYKPLQETDRDGFCCTACKQAHYRALKKYVTLQVPRGRAAAGQGITQKTLKKRRSKNGKVKKKKNR